VSEQSEPAPRATSELLQRTVAQRFDVGEMVVVPLLSVVLALIIGALIMLASGVPFTSIGKAYAALFTGSVGSVYALSETLIAAAPLTLAGLGIALGFRAGLFNIGVEGQLYLGGFAAGLAGLALAGLPGPLPLLGCALAAALAGGAWGAIPGALKARFGAHEVINTIMLNFVAFALVSYLGRPHFEFESVRTAELPAGAWIPRLDVLLPVLRGSPANLALLLGAALAVAVGAFLFRTRRGYELRAVGFSAPAAEYGGISVGRAQLLAMGLSGAIAGLGGLNYVNGYKHWFELGFSAGAGFLGIAVALIGRNHPLGVTLAALFFGALSYGGLVVNRRVPKELVEVLEGIVILFAISAQQLAERWARRLR
jgi:simple sugar transport system permease protein